MNSDYCICYECHECDCQGDETPEWCICNCNTDCEDCYPDD